MGSHSCSLLTWWVLRQFRDWTETRRILASVRLRWSLRQVHLCSRCTVTDVTRQGRGEVSRTRSRVKVTGNVTSQSTSKGHGARSQGKVTEQGHGARSRIKVTDQGHGPRSRIKVTEQGHGSRSRSKVTGQGHGDQGHGSRSRIKVTDQGHRARSRIKVTDQGHGPRSRTKVTDQGHGARSQGKVTDQGHGSRSRVEATRWKVIGRGQGHGVPLYSRRPSAEDALKTISMSVKVDRELVTRPPNSRYEWENDGK